MMVAYHRKCCGNSRADTAFERPDTKHAPSQFVVFSPPSLVPPPPSRTFRTSPHLCLAIETRGEGEEEGETTGRGRASPTRPTLAPTDQVPTDQVLGAGFWSARALSSHVGRKSRSREDSRERLGLPTERASVLTEDPSETISNNRGEFPFPSSDTRARLPRIASSNRTHNSTCAPSSRPSPSGNKTSTKMSRGGAKISLPISAAPLEVFPVRRAHTLGQPAPIAVVRCARQRSSWPELVAHPCHLRTAWPPHCTMPCSARCTHYNRSISPACPLRSRATGTRR